MKKIIALILALILTLSVSPLAFATDKAQQRDVWDMISELERRAERRSGSSTVEELTAVYNGMIEEIIDTVTSSSTYVPDSLERHGNFFFWMDTNGDPNGYSPSLRARQRVGEIPGADPEDYAATEIVNYNARGGSPASINVAAFQPYIGIDGSFTAQYENRCNAIAQATGGVGTTYKTNDANINNLGLALSTCGVVIFDSHGTTDYDNGSWSNPDYTSQANDSYLCLTTGTGITAQDKQSAQGQYGTYYHAFQSGSTWCVDGTAMANHMTTNAPNSMVWMAICLGMATDGMEAPFRSHGVEVVYGYSQSVTFTGDYKYEGYFWPYMCEDHTVAESCAYMKQMSGCDWDPAYSSYSYSQAVSNHVAFPIVASSEDVYPGHGNVDVIQVPNSLWTLFTQFNIAACSNNESWGTVSVSGRQITANPAVGYEVVGYEILDGICTVTQNGNVFQVQAETDCSIRINFAARVPASVHYVVPEGLSCEDFDGYVGDSYELPTPAGELAADAYHYRFLGWVQAELEEDSQEMPDFQKAGTLLTVAAPQTTYYALYKYFVAEDGVTEGQFTLVTKAPTSWAGDYVITYQGTKVLDASGTITGVSIGGSSAAKDLSAIGGTLENDVLYNIPDEYIYTFEPAGDGAYGLKMKEHDVYLALTSDSNALMTAEGTNKSTAKWNISYSSAGVQIANSQFTARTIRFNDKAKLFRCYKTGQQQISLYSAGDGTTWFTTSPKNKTVCEEHSFGDWTTVIEPTCTGSGKEKRVCTVCGFVEYNDLPALGHTPGEAVKENETTPTCTEPGGYDMVTYCTVCGDELERVHTEIPAQGHVPGEAVKENETEPNCTEPGGYDMVTYCTVCGNELERVHTEIPALGHIPGDPVKENEIPATCTEAGGYDMVTKCSVCSVELSREHVDVPASGHIPGEPVRENETPSTCTEAGGYDLVTYCSVCGEKLSSERIDFEVLGHEWDEGVVTVEPTETTVGTMLFTCTRCGATREEEIPVLQHDCKIAHFTDVSEQYPYGTPEHEAIEWAFTHDPQVTAGTSDTTFGVGKAVKRADAMFYLWVAAGKPEPTLTESPFTDVSDPKAYYYKAVLWAYENGITSGTSDTLFGRKKTVTRRDMMVFLYKQQGSPKVTLTESPYTDVTDPGAYYYKAVMWAYEKGIDKGADGKFDHKTNCLRETVVLWMYRTLETKALAE